MNRVALAKRRMVPLFGGVAVTVLIGATVACLTSPPPDLIVPSLPPTIIYASLVPPQGLVTDLPPESEFIVPIGIADLSAPCQYSLYVDGVLEKQSDCDITSVDAGVIRQSFFLSATLDPTVCHEIVFALATESATWNYVPPTCVVYDAGALQNGSFPDAAADALPIVPDS